MVLFVPMPTFSYRPAVVRRALEHEADIALCVDTDWRTRYADRSQHPEDDAEKIVAEGDRVVEVNRAIPAPAASGEYIGVARFSVAVRAVFAGALSAGEGGVRRADLEGRHAI